jgi:tetrahydromethanopterin S-methyltransferase subunit G
MKKTTTKKKEMTLDDLAVMVAKGFEKVDERFNKIDQKFKDTDSRFETIDENFKKVRRDILELNDKFVSRHQFDNVLSRLSVLEAKVKGKK